MKLKSLLSIIAISAISIGQSNAQCSITSQPYNYCGFGDQIDAIKLNGISSPNSSGCSSSGYGGRFNTPNWTFAPGGTVSYDITVGGGVYDEGVAIWIDLNQNGSYENSEQVWASTTYTQNFTGSFTIPASATPGTTYMRVRCAWINTISAGEACTANIGYGYGETEDYKITICNPPSFTAQPQGAIACENGSGTVAAKTTGADSHLWQVNVGTGWTTVSSNSTYSNVTSDTLRLHNTPTTLNGATFRCIAAGCGGITKDTSDEVTLTVHKNTHIEEQTKNDTSCVSVNTLLRVKAEGVIMNHQWQIYNNTTNSYVDISSSPFVINGDTLRVENVPDTLNGAKIRCIVNGICGSDTTADMNMIVQALPKVVTSPSDIVIDQGKTAKFNVVAAGVNVKYKWQVGYKDTFANVNNGTYTGVKTDEITVPFVSRGQNEFQFRCLISGSGSCAAKEDTSEIALLLVNEPASVGTIAKENGIAVYPNPASGNTISVEVSGIAASVAPTFIITDKTGRTISTGNVDVSNATKIDITNTVPGLYNIQILNKDGEVLKSSKFSKL